MEKVRDIVPDQLPDGPLPKGQVVLAPLGGRKTLAKHTTLVASVRTLAAVMPECVRIWRTDNRGLGKRLERIRAEMLLGASRETLSPAAMHQLGFRRAWCRCAPGCGHLA